MADLTPREARGEGSETDGVLLCVAENCARREFGDFFAAVVRDAMAREGIGTPRSGERYDTDSVVAVYERVAERVGPNALERVGRRVPVVVDWPREVRDVGDAFGALDRVHDGLHGGDAGGYEFVPTGQTSGRLTSTTPYPAPFDEGLVYGIGDRFGEETGFLVLDRTTEDRETTVTCRWWDLSEGS